LQNNEIIFKTIVVITYGDSYNLEININNEFDSKKVNQNIFNWIDDDDRYKLLKTFFIEIRKCLYYLKITKKLFYKTKAYNPYDIKKEIHYSIDNKSKFDLLIKNHLFDKYLDIGFKKKTEKVNERHYKCILYF